MSVNTSYSKPTTRDVSTFLGRLYYYSSFLFWSNTPQGKSLRVFLLLFIVSSHAVSQNKTLDQVTVYGARGIKHTAISKTDIDTTAIAESAGATMAELLARHSTIHVKTYGQGSLATVAFRGTAASHTQVEWNGLNINNPMVGQVDFSMIPVNLIDKTEIFYGSSSLQNGSGALGGAINISSEPRWDDKMSLDLSQSVGSFGAYESFVSALLVGKKMQGRFRYLYQVSENDFRYKNIAVPPFNYTRQTNARVERHGGVLDLYYKTKDQHYFKLNLWYMRADRDLPTVMSYQGPGRTEYQLDDELRIAGSWNKYFAAARSELILGFTSTKLKYFLGNKTDYGLFISSNTENAVLSYTTKYNFEYQLSERTLLKAQANANYHSVDIQDLRMNTRRREHRFEAGLSLSAHHSFSDKISAFALVREDFVDGTFSSVMPSVGVEYKPISSEKLLLKVNAAGNYHHPTLNDLYWIPGGNPELKPERGYSGDFAAQYGKQLGRFALKGEATLFASLIDDWIMWRPSEFSWWRAENVKQVFSRGTEIRLQSSYAHGGLNLKLSANYSYTKSSDQSPEALSSQLMYIPIHKSNAMFDASYRGWYGYYVWSLTGSRFTDDTTFSLRHSLPAYDLHDVTVGKRFKIGGVSVDANVKVNNIFGKSYQAILWRAMPLRSFVCGVKVSYLKK